MHLKTEEDQHMFETVKETISSVCMIDAGDIKEDSNLVSDLGLNSFELINLIIAFEEKFGIEIDDEELPEFETVSDIAEFLEERV